MICARVSASRRRSLRASSAACTASGEHVVGDRAVALDEHGVDEARL